MATPVFIDHSREHFRFLQMHLGGDRNFCYLLGDARTGRAAAIDPGFRPERMLDIANENGLEILYVLGTHGHADHVGGAARLVELTGAELHAGPEDRVAGAEPLRDGQRFPLGDLHVEAIRTPGHTSGHFCFLFEGHLVTGDLLFCGKVGGTGDHFPGSDARAEWDSLARLMQLPEPTGVFPGHDYYGGEGEMPHSSIGHEKRHNPFLTAPDFAAFVHLKDHWAAYKEEHGIR